MKSILSLLLHTALGTATVYLFFLAGAQWSQGHIALSAVFAVVGAALSLIAVFQFMVHLAVHSGTPSLDPVPAVDPVRYTIMNVAISMARTSISTWIVATLVRDPSVLVAGGLFLCLEVCLAVWCSWQGLKAARKAS